MSFRKTIWLYISIFKIKPISYYQILDYCIDWSLFRKFYHFKMERYSKYDRPSSSKIWLFNRYLVYTFQLLLVLLYITKEDLQAQWSFWNLCIVSSSEYSSSFKFEGINLYTFKRDREKKFKRLFERLNKYKNWCCIKILFHWSLFCKSQAI